ncbi:hypothetical protein ACQR3P_28850 [Rhodococcus sp. IEGM1300]
MTQLDTTEYPLSLSELQPHRKEIENLDFDTMLGQLYSYQKIRSLGLGGSQLNSHRASLCLSFPEPFDREALLSSLRELNPNIFSEEGQILGHDHEVCPIDHLYLSRQDNYVFEPATCLGAAIFPSEGNPNGLLLNDILLKDKDFNQPYYGDQLLEINRSLYENVFRPLAKLFDGTFVFSSYN